MALTSGPGIWLSIQYGKLSYKDHSGQKRTCQTVSGVITAIKYENDTYQDKVHRRIIIDIEDGEEKYVLSVRVNTGYGSQLQNKLANCDIAKPVEITPKDEGNNKTGMFITQGGASLKQRWTKDNQGDLPHLEKVDGKWDSSKQNAFMEKWIMDNVAVKCGGVREESYYQDDGGDPPF